MIKLPTREDFERLVNINTERNEWNHDYYAHLPARQQWKAWQTAIAEVQRLNATAQPVSDGWVKCSDRLPDKNGRYLILFTWMNNLENVINIADFLHTAYETPVMRWNYRSEAEITHWMPLPAAPGGQDD